MYILKLMSTVNIDFPVTDDAGDVVTVSLVGNPSFIKLQSLAEPTTGSLLIL